MPERLEKLATQAGLTYSGLSIKNMKSQWGSCSYVNNINLSLHLMKLNDDLIDYVIMHELCHTVEKNHGKGFWNLLESLMPGANELDRSLKKYHPLSY